MVLGGPQPVKVLSPEILFLTERAEVIFNTVGNILRRAAASGAESPGVGPGGGGRSGRRTESAF